MSVLWISVTRIQVCTSLNHRKRMKAKPGRLIPGRLVANLQFLKAGNLCHIFLLAKIIQLEKGFKQIHVHL